MLLPIPDKTTEVRRQTLASPSSLPSSDQAPGPPNNTTAVVAIIAAAAGLSILTFCYLLLRIVRRRHSNPKYIPTQLLKRRWQAWHPGMLGPAKAGYTARLQSDSSAPTLASRTDASSNNIPRDLEQTEAELAMVDVNRQTSVRSVMTLPAYSKIPRETEQLIASEGERDGVDVLLEAPETAEEEEALREEEMESLYQIRQQRRLEIAEREDRRQRRREARDRGDVAEMARIRQESLVATQVREISGASAMIAEHHSRSRERRVSSVNYADLGVARHDGTRVRANSNASDQPLLDSAASIGGTSARRGSGPDSLSVYHDRGRSGSVGDSISEDETPMAAMRRSASGYEIITLSQTQSRDTSTQGRPRPHQRATSNISRIDTADLGEAAPRYDGEGFEEAPPYESPVRERHPEQSSTTVPRLNTTGAPMLPELRRLPSLRIVEPTPVDTRPPMSFPGSR